MSGHAKHCIICCGSNPGRSCKKAKAGKRGRK